MTTTALILIICVAGISVCQLAIQLLSLRQQRTKTAKTAVPETADVAGAISKETAIEQERLKKQIAEENKAFAQMMGYNRDWAYGINRALNGKDGGE